MGRGAAARAAPDARRRDDGLLRLGARGTAAEAGRNECAVARNGRRAQFRPVQPRPADLCRVEAYGYRAAVRTAVVTAWRAAKTQIPYRRICAAQAPRNCPAP